MAHECCDTPTPERRSSAFSTVSNPTLQGTGTSCALGSFRKTPAVCTIKFPTLEILPYLDNVIHRSFNLVGCGTQIVGASSSRTSVSEELVAKFSWLDKRRASEKMTIEHVVKGAPGPVEDYPLKVFASYDNYDTMAIRHRLGISLDSRRPLCVSQIPMFERLYPITTVSGLDCISVYVQCVKRTSKTPPFPPNDERLPTGHYLVWGPGVEY
ncbi:hypothetical protein FRC07_010613 [Ceratobasidium sp. 392]|nr:hypothetical protein FRC07_010613 [Ceratobasidium sp. 392]